MQSITIKETSKILIDEKLNNLDKYIPSSSNVIIITDTNLYRLYAQKFPDVPVITIKAGEQSKSLKTIDFIIHRLIELQADRHSFLLGIGGGVVCDITGFVASIFMRGINFGFVSSSLLSQIDASVGGKNGVNFESYKNLIGTFNQPEFVICNTDMLHTLPKQEIKNGIAEMLKHALIADKKMVQFISNNVDKILNLDTDVLPDLIYDNIKIKATIVDTDEKENGERRKLNFGHTLAHAIEKHSNIAHGEAVAIGIVFASRISHLLNYISENDVNDIIRILQQFGLPTSTKLDKTQLANAILGDKKRNGENIEFVLLEKIGESKIKEVKISDIKQWIYDLC